MRESIARPGACATGPAKVVDGWESMARPARVVRRVAVGYFILATYDQLVVGYRAVVGVAFDIRFSFFVIGRIVTVDLRVTRET